MTKVCPCDWCTKSRRRKLPLKSVCSMCGKNDPEYYIVKDDVWRRAKVIHREFSCLSCLEKGLRRRLTILDFPDHIPVNMSIIEGFFSVKEISLNDSKETRAGKILRDRIKNARNKRRR